MNFPNVDWFWSLGDMILRKIKFENTKNDPQFIKMHGGKTKAKDVAEKTLFGGVSANEWPYLSALRFEFPEMGLQPFYFFLIFRIRKSAKFQRN